MIEFCLIIAFGILMLAIGMGFVLWHMKKIAPDAYAEFMRKLEEEDEEDEDA